MKKIILIFLILPSIMMAQEPPKKVTVIKSDQQIENFTSSLGKNELKIDFLDFLIGPALTIGYEKINNSSSGFGTTLLLNLDGNDTSEDLIRDKFALTPYYRFYFLQSEDFGGYGIFAEVFTKFSSTEYKAYNGQGSSKITNDFDIAPGLAVGRKWINRKGFTFELLFGVGRNILYSDDEDYSGWYSESNRTAGKVRAGVTLGKRF